MCFWDCCSKTIKPSMRGRGEPFWMLDHPFLYGFGSQTGKIIQLFLFAGLNSGAREYSKYNDFFSFLVQLFLGVIVPKSDCDAKCRFRRWHTRDIDGCKVIGINTDAKMIKASPFMLPSSGRLTNSTPSDSKRSQTA